MIELKRDRLVFSFPDVHPEAKLEIGFQRTFRIPDDGKTYPLPPGFGFFPLCHVDDHARRVPADWLERGGVMLPMYQSEAMWLLFTAHHVSRRWASYPFAIKVAAGKINAVTGKGWSDGLNSKPQDYMVAPRQPWLDGFCVQKGLIRQFVAMPLGAGYTAEEQLTGKAEHGGLQIVIYPMKREVFERRFPERELEERESYRSFAAGAVSRGAKYKKSDMGLAPGGRMKQEIYEDPFDFDDWDLTQRGRCFVHIANSLVWREVAGRHPPTTPPTAKEYAKAGLPWFDYYDDNAKALEGAESLAGLKSVAELGEEKGDVPLPENDSVTPETVIKLRRNLQKDEVREGRF
ncbi:MAG TPA: hypothetical protein VKD90_03890 [Gemmataceae bacterium]|nr:hypothetical protein [Gemmataceae bacterium]